MLKNITSGLTHVLVLAICSQLFGQSDSKEWDYYGFVVSATEEEQNKFDNAAAKNSAKIQKLSTQLRDLEQQVRKLELEQDLAVERLLKPEQIRAINEQRLKETQQRAAVDTGFLKDFANFANGIVAANEIQVFEGLPRGVPADIVKIKSESKTIELDGFDFYATALDVRKRPMAIEQLREMLAGHRSFSPTETGGGGKFCGGFHPDICLKYNVGNADYRLHLCLGCHEILVVGPEILYRFDYDRSAWKNFSDIDNSISENHASKVPQNQQK